MRFGSPDRWVILRFSDDSVEYRDDRRTKADARAVTSAILSPKIESLLAASIALARTERRRLAVFLQPSDLPYSTLLNRVRELPSVKDGAANVRFALLSPHDEPLNPFSLPLRIAAVGTMAKHIAGFASRDFAQAAQNYGGLEITHVDPHRLHDIPDDADVVLANEVDALTVLHMKSKNRLHPRLIVAAAEHDSSSLLDELESPADPDAPLHSPSLLFLPPGSASNAEEVLYGIVHDKPLHDIAADTHGLLVSNPAAMQSLRVSDAFADAARNELADAIGGVQPEPRREHVVAPLGLARLLDRTYDAVQEWGAFFPAVESAYLRGSENPSWKPVKIPASVQTPQRRRVDARVERVEPAPETLMSRSTRDVLWIPANRTLCNDSRYRLRIQIGRDFPGNLISRKIRDLDALLPPAKGDGWDLDVVVFAKDFRLHSDALQKLWLGRAGASEPLYFDIQAPSEGSSAQLRFAIYHGNHLLQSFLLTAALTPEEREQEGALRVDLDLARSDAFANIDALAPRALSIGVNLDSDGAHRALVKFDEIGREIRLDDKELKARLLRFRQAMEAASAKGDDPVFPAEGSAQTPAQEAAFASAIRELACVGKEIHDALFDARRDRDLRDKFRSVRTNEDQTLQFTRYDSTFTIPWAILYDYELPDDVASAPVCDGTTSGARCGHDADSGVMCIRGFWGTRHIIEEQLGSSSPTGAIASVTRPAGRAAICIADGVRDGSLRTIETALKDRGVAAEIIEPPKDVLDILWQDASRPAVMMLLGHLEGTGSNRRLRIPGTDAWLTAESITNFAAKHSDWTQPNAIVLLMACKAMDPTSTMLHHHAQALIAAGAAAVVGPESSIFSDFACRVARDILLPITTTAPPRRLGEVLTDLRRTLASQHNPLGFAFTTYGDTDVVIQ